MNNQQKYTIKTMSITKAFRKINESGYAVNSALMWSRIDLREALGVAGYNDLEIARLSELEQDDMLNDFFNYFEPEIIETIKEMMEQYFTKKREYDRTL